MIGGHGWFGSVINDSHHMYLMSPFVSFARLWLCTCLQYALTCIVSFLLWFISALL